MFRPFKFKQNEPKQLKGSRPTITFLEDGVGIFFSTGFVDLFKLEAGIAYQPLVEVETHRIRLVRCSDCLSCPEVVRTAKAGGKSKNNNDRIMIRMNKLFEEIGVNPKSNTTVYPVVSDECAVITFSYKEALNVSK